MIDEGIRLTLLLPLLIGSTQSELSLHEFYSIKDLLLEKTLLGIRHGLSHSFLELFINLRNRLPIADASEETPDPNGKTTAHPYTQKCP